MMAAACIPAWSRADQWFVGRSGSNRERISSPLLSPNITSPLFECMSYNRTVFTGGGTEQDLVNSLVDNTRPAGGRGPGRVESVQGDAVGQEPSLLLGHGGQKDSDEAAQEGGEAVHREADVGPGRGQVPGQQRLRVQGAGHRDRPQQEADTQTRPRGNLCTKESPK